MKDSKRQRYGPTDDEIEDWARRAQKTRRDWAKGPSKKEKAAWARREARRRKLRTKSKRIAGGALRLTENVLMRGASRLVQLARAESRSRRRRIRADELT